MRFFLVISIWIVIVGGLWSYISHRDFNRQQIVAASPVDLHVDGKFSMEITSTFSTEEDPFALTTTSATTSTFEVKLNGIPMVTDEATLQRGQSIRYENITGMLEGQNEIYVAATPPLLEDTLEHGIRVKLYKGQTLIIDKTVWASLGTQVSGTVSFNHAQNKEDDHDH